MSKRNKFTTEQRIEIINLYLSQKYTISQIARIYQLNISTIYNRLNQYKYGGLLALAIRKKNKTYSKEFKLKVVKAYLNNEGSYSTLAAKYGLSDTRPLRNWVLQYNSHIKLKDYNPKVEVYMATSRRKTTQEERQKIVNWCLNHDHNYKLTAEKFDCSYAQVYNWVRKFREKGSAGLTDRRGRQKTEAELTELEKANRKIKELEHKLKMAKMENEFSKKLQKLERELMLDELKHK